MVVLYLYYDNVFKIFKILILNNFEGVPSQPEIFLDSDDDMVQPISEYFYETVNSSFQVSWSKPEDNGADIDYYRYQSTH